MKTFLSTALLATCMASAAMAADTYTFAGTNTPGTAVAGQGPGGRPIFGGVSTFDNVVTDSAGKKSASKGNCASWSAQPGELLAVHGICDGDGDAGKIQVFFSCSAVDPKTGLGSCWGVVKGVSGKYAGKTGSASWQAKSNGPGKGGSSQGAGVWND